MSKHTPGPWNTCKAGSFTLVECPNGGTVAQCEFSADAKLIAAAPELLEALHIAQGEADYAMRYKHGDDLKTLQSVVKNILKILNSTIDKAEGK